MQRLINYGREGTTISGKICPQYFVIPPIALVEKSVIPPIPRDWNFVHGQEVPPYLIRYLLRL